MLESRQADSPNVSVLVHGLPEPTSPAAKASAAQLVNVSNPLPGGTMWRNLVILVLCFGAILAATTAWILTKKVKRVNAK